MDGARLLCFGLCVSFAQAASRWSGCGSIRGASAGRAGPPAGGTWEHALRPAPWVFGVVWSVLYATTGVVWAFGGSHLDARMALVTGLCAAWVPLYTCGRSPWLPVAAVGAAFLASLVVSAEVARSGGRWLHALSALLPAWLAYALVIGSLGAVRDARLDATP